MRATKSSFFRLFSTGFVAGAIAVVAMQPAEATRMVTEHLPVSTTR